MPTNIPSEMYKILTPDEMESFIKEGQFIGSPLDQESGFIHCATKELYPKVMQKFFKDVRPLYLVTLDPQKLDQKYLKVEANHEGGSEYPHYYAPLPFSAVKEGQLIQD